MDIDLNSLLGQVVLITSAGVGRLSGFADYLLALFTVLAFVLPFVLGALRPDFDPLSSLVSKVILIGFFIFLVSQWGTIAAASFSAFAGLGLLAGGGEATLDDFLQPWGIAAVGFSLFRVLLEQVADLIGPLGVFVNLPEIVLLLVAAFGVLASFLVMALAVFYAIVEFQLVVLAALVLLPFGVFSPVSFLAQRGIGAFAGSIIRIFLLALIFSFGQALFTLFETTTEMTLVQATKALVASLFFATMALLAPRIATGFIVGTPSLGAAGPLALGTTIAVGSTRMTRGAVGAAQTAAPYVHAGYAAIKAAVTPGGGKKS